MNYYHNRSIYVFVYPMYLFISCFVIHSGHLKCFPNTGSDSQRKKGDGKTIALTLIYLQN